MPGAQSSEHGGLHRAIVQAATAEHRAHRMMQEQEREARHWHDRAAWARSRGEEQLATAALLRGAEHAQRAARLAEIYQAAGARVRSAKRHLRDVEAGRGPPPLPLRFDESLEAQFEALQREEHLDSQLAELKARVSESGASEMKETNHGNA